MNKSAELLERLRATETHREVLAKAKTGGQPEAALKRTITKYLQWKGWRVKRIQQSALSEPGLPDLFCFKDGRVVFVEVKTPKGRLSPHQEAFRRECVEECVPYIVARGIEDVLDMVK